MVYLVIVYYQGTRGSALIQQKYKEISNISNRLYDGLLLKLENLPWLILIDWGNNLFSDQRCVLKLIGNFYLWPIILGIITRQIVDDGQIRVKQKADHLIIKIYIRIRIIIKTYIK